MKGWTDSREFEEKDARKILFSLRSEVKWGLVTSFRSSVDARMGRRRRAVVRLIIVKGVR